MKHLYLLRHAKSSWEETAVPDSERPLAPRGHKATVLLAADLRRERITPALVLCSPARRARETLEGIAEALGEDGAVRIEPQLYGASAGDLLERLRKIPESVPSVMLIGHNPAIQELAATLAHGDEQVATVERKYPTGALATFALDAAWRELSEATAELVRFVRPKDLR